MMREDLNQPCFNKILGEKMSCFKRKLTVDDNCFKKQLRLLQMLQKDPFDVEIQIA